MASCIIVGSVFGMAINYLIADPCKEGYARVTMIGGPSVCVLGYVQK